MSKLRGIALGIAVLGVSALGGTSPAQALPAGEQVASPVGAQCTQVWQYTVTSYGDMTNAESGGSFVGWAYPNDTFNVRIQGSPRYYGFNVANGKWGWILSGKLQYTGNTWCA
ncbi:hypothetical protein V1227_39380 [Lentzea sp. DG1S-22]|uniref:hypothetical protein n=1 Tax=Lentzea sp. DG1S-22 TaxID=3108822 RepID=UPI002E7A33BF|nr:hypothetical protein [Lentzea sp. DG1S-22]WVH80976.1 hypothetical protein V1227_39380 [Lentzea sp. DG1S-22]